MAHAMTLNRGGSTAAVSLIHPCPVSPMRSHSHPSPRSSTSYVSRRISLYKMTSLVSPDVSRQQCRILPARGSCSSIDLNSLCPLGSSLDNLLSYSLLLPSSTTDSLSLRNVPPFPTHAVPPLYLNAFEDLPRKRPADPKWTSDAVITIPTSPRLRNTMMEAICIDWWRVRNRISLCISSLTSRRRSRTYPAAHLPPVL